MNNFDILKQAQDLLQKAFKPDQWDKIKRSTSQEGAETVDHTAHVNEDIHPSYLKHANDVNFKPKHLGKNMTGGISQKMVTTDGGENDPVFMTKPYHKKIESATKTWVKSPILGWATMATKALFNAANIGHMVEDVKTHVHDNVPVTVHQFDNNKKDLGYRSVRAGHKYDEPSLHKIVVMDYLTNNRDRHQGNLLVDLNPTIQKGDEPPRRGFLAIDHERNFQYYRQPRSSSGTHAVLSDYTRSGAISELSVSPYFSKHDFRNKTNDVREWWEDNKHNIMNEFDKQIQHIKDKRTADHVSQNFKLRWNTLDNAFQNADLFGDLNEQESAVPIIPKARASAKTKKWVEQNLSGMHGYEKIKHIHYLGDKSKNESSKITLKNHWEDTVNQLDADDTIKYLQQYGRSDTPFLDDGVYINTLQIAMKNPEKVAKLLAWDDSESRKAGILPDSDERPHGVGLLPYWREKLQDSLKKDGEKV